MIKFEKVSRFANADFDMPVRKTANSAGYDMVVAEDIIIPSYESLMARFGNVSLAYTNGAPTLEQLAQMTKSNQAKPTLVSTGVKCYLEPGYYLELSVRSSSPLKYWIILANGVGIIDADYADNKDNEGEIFFQVINFSPFPIQLRKGDIIGQGIIKKYEVTDDDKAEGVREGGFGSTTGAAVAAMQMATPEYNTTYTKNFEKEIYAMNTSSPEAVVINSMPSNDVVEETLKNLKKAIDTSFGQVFNNA